MRAAMIIAHPDDDALFGGPLQRVHSENEWHVVCATYDAAQLRGRELVRWQAANGCFNTSFLGLHDNPTDYERGVSSFDEGDVLTRLARLNLNVDLCLTHNDLGEYGHPHHVVVGAAARSWARSHGIAVLEFGFGLAQSDFSIEVADFVDEAVACYSSQAHLLRIHHREDGLLRRASYRWCETFG